MIIFLYGKDTFRSRQHLKKMKTKFKADRDPQGLNLMTLDCEKEPESTIWEQILAAPFLAERRMVVLENLLASKHKELHEKLHARIKENTLPDSSVIIIWESLEKVKTKVGKVLLKELSEQKFSQKFDLLSGIQINKWIETEVTERGGTINREATQYLAQHIGSDMWRLHSLIDQLISYKQQKPINLEDVTLFLDEKADDNIFNLIDAIVAKNTKQVFAMMQEQYNQGKDAHYIFAMLLRQYKIMLQLKDLEERNQFNNPSTVAKQVGLHPFVVKKSLPVVKKYSFSELKHIYQSLLDIDTKVKTGQGDQQMLVDVFIGRISSQT